MASLNIESWTPSYVAQWVKGLGPQFLSHGENFVDEEINGKALLTINPEYLTELSIENVNDQSAILDAVICLNEVELCLQGETVHGQVVAVNDQTKLLVNKLEKEGQHAVDGDVTTSEASTKIAIHVYQLTKKLLSWLLRSPFSEMNACWPLKDAVCRVVRDMTDETLLKNRAHLQENLTKLHNSFENFLNEEPVHEAFKQSPILVDEEFILEGEGLGIGITTAHHVHTVNSVSTESPAGKNGNIKNGDEIVNVNGQCVIAWPQKNVINLMKSKSDSVSLTLKKLPPVKGPLNKPLDKPGTPLSEMNVVMDRTKVAPERQARAEMKEAGIKEETSLEMQAIENENASEEASQVEAKIEGIKEEDETNGERDGNTEAGVMKVENIPGKEDVTLEIKENEEPKPETPAKEDEPVAKPQTQNEERKEVTVEQEDSQQVVENIEPEKNERADEIVENVDEERQGDVVLETEKKKEIETGVESAAFVSPASVAAEADIKASEEEPARPELAVTSEPARAGAVASERTNAETDEAISVVSEPAKPPAVAVSEPVKSESTITESAITEPAKNDSVIVSGGVENVEVNGDLKVNEVEAPVKIEEENGLKDGKVGNGKVETPEKPEVLGEKKSEENKEQAPKPGENGTNIEVTVESASPKKEASVIESSQNGPSVKKEPSSPTKKQGRHKMNLGSVKEVTVKGASTKQVEVYGSSKVVRREKKIGGAPNKRISCIELGEADYEGWLTKRSGGHGLTPTRWRRQWCVLKEEHLYYYKTSFDREAGGVIEITGYNMSAAPEIKKPFAFKCEKDSGKKYFFHADHEVDREAWIKELNLTARGERKPKELGAGQIHEVDGRKGSISGLKVSAPTNRPRTGSVLAGIRFNYYDDDDEESRKTAPAQSAAQRVNDRLFNGDAKSSTLDKVAANQDVLKIAVGVQEDACPCPVAPEIDGEKGEVRDKKGPSKEDTSESPEKVTAKEQSNELQEESAVSVNSNGQKKDTQASQMDEVSATEGINGHEAIVNADSKGEVVAKVDEEIQGSEGASEDKNVEVKLNTETVETAASESVDIATKSEDVESKSEDCAMKPEAATAKSESDTAKSESDTAKSESDTAKSENEAGVSEELPKDEFKAVAESIKEADIGLDGTEKSPEALLRRLSINSKNDIMDKVVKLRVLRQSLKDKEKSMNAIDELLSSDVTPESIAEWRAKYEIVTGANSCDLNENSQV